MHRIRPQITDSKWPIVDCTSRDFRTQNDGLHSEMAQNPLIINGMDRKVQKVIAIKQQKVIVIY